MMLLYYNSDDSYYLGFDVGIGSNMVILKTSYCSMMFKNNNRVRFDYNVGLDPRSIEWIDKDFEVIRDIPIHDYDMVGNVVTIYMGDDVINGVVELVSTYVDPETGDVSTKIQVSGKEYNLENIDEIDINWLVSDYNHWYSSDTDFTDLSIISKSLYSEISTVYDGGHSYDIASIYKRLSPIYSKHIISGEVKEICPFSNTDFNDFILDNNGVGSDVISLLSKLSVYWLYNIDDVDLPFGYKFDGIIVVSNYHESLLVEMSFGDKIKGKVSSDVLNSIIFNSTRQ